MRAKSLCSRKPSRRREGRHNHDGPLVEAKHDGLVGKFKIEGGGTYTVTEAGRTLFGLRSGMPQKSPIFEAAAAKHTDITWGKVDTEAQQELSAGFGIRSIPTLMVFRDGIVVFQNAGMVPGAALDELVEKVRALDMDDVRKQLAAQQASGQ